MLPRVQLVASLKLLQLWNHCRDSSPGQAPARLILHGRRSRAPPSCLPQDSSNGQSSPWGSSVSCPFQSFSQSYRDVFFQPHLAPQVSDLQHSQRLPLPLLFPLSFILPPVHLLYFWFCLSICIWVDLSWHGMLSWLACWWFWRQF